MDQGRPHEGGKTKLGLVLKDRMVFKEKARKTDTGHGGKMVNKVMEAGKQLQCFSMLALVRITWGGSLLT